MVDRRSGCSQSTVVMQKGTSDKYAVQCCVEFLDRMAHPRIVLQTDPEPSIIAVARQVVAKRASPTVHRETPRKSHQSNGAIERYHQSMQGEVRTLKSVIEREASVKLTDVHPIDPWMIRHASWVLTRFQPKSNNSTAFSKLTGKHYSSEIAQFGEHVLYLDPKEPAPKLESRWFKGIWLGRAQ